MILPSIFLFTLSFQPLVIASILADNLASNYPPESFLGSICLLAELCVVADYCFGISMRSELDPPASEERLIAILHAGIKEYKDHHQESLLKAMHTHFSDVAVDVWMSGEKEELRTQLKEFIMNHRMPKATNVEVM
ncbi:hypothetical protein FRB94_005135 [Tulasnella sp. JGI-2019a]|nr:hypothetical protein FRB94_005135 [Tulasnella sp. JGI-2019a]